LSSDPETPSENSYRYHLVLADVETRDSTGLGQSHRARLK
jgi:hypothetical protein